MLHCPFILIIWVSFHDLTFKHYQGYLGQAAEGWPCKWDSWRASSFRPISSSGGDQVATRAGGWFFNYFWLLIHESWMMENNPYPTEVGEELPHVTLAEAHLLLCLLPSWQVRWISESLNLSFVPLAMFNCCSHQLSLTSDYWSHQFGVHISPLSPNEFEIVSNFPKRRLAFKPTEESEGTITLAEAGFSKSEMFFVNNLES